MGPAWSHWSEILLEVIATHFFKRKTHSEHSELILDILDILNILNSFWTF